PSFCSRLTAIPAFGLRTDLTTFIDDQRAARPPERQLAFGPMRRPPALFRDELRRQRDGALEDSLQLGCNGPRAERDHERIADVARYAHGNAGEHSTDQVADKRDAPHEAVDALEWSDEHRKLTRVVDERDVPGRCEPHGVAAESALVDHEGAALETAACRQGPVGKALFIQLGSALLERPGDVRQGKNVAEQREFHHAAFAGIRADRSLEIGYEILRPAPGAKVRVQVELARDQHAPLRQAAGRALELLLPRCEVTRDVQAFLGSRNGERERDAAELHFFQLEVSLLLFERERRDDRLGLPLAVLDEPGAKVNMTSHGQRPLRPQCALRLVL